MKAAFNPIFCQYILELQGIIDVMASRKQQFLTYSLATREQLFGLDLRSLAIFRIGLALLIIIDLIRRSEDLKAHYTDFGILPRAALLEHFSNSWRWSIHLFSGELIFQSLLFIIAGLAAFCLLIGYKTRFFTILCWVLMMSLHNRNWMILNSGDIEFRLFLFWGIFLPLGACYSVDSALNSSPNPLPKRILSGATLALTLQICFIYWFAWFLKSDPIWWQEGSAVYYALNLDYIVTRFGQFLLNFPDLLVFTTFSTLWLELLGPFFLFIPFRTDFFRFCTVIVFILLHLGFRLGLIIGLFPFVSIVAWLVFLPSSFWDKIHQKIRTQQTQGLKIYYDRECDFCKKMVHLLCTFLILPRRSLIVLQDKPEILTEMKDENSWVVVDWQGNNYFQFQAITYVCRLSPLIRPIFPLLNWYPLKFFLRKIYEIIANNRFPITKISKLFIFRPLQVSISFATNIVTVFFLTCITLWNLRIIAPSLFKLPKAIDGLSFVLGLDQKWSMFAPYPKKNDGWYVIPGKLKNGTEIDVFQEGEPVNWEKPTLVSATYRNQRWRKYLSNLHSQKNKKRRLYYGRYLCRNWNTKHKGEKQLNTFEIYFMLEKTLPNYQIPKVKKILLWKHSCFKKPQQ